MLALHITENTFGAACCGGGFSTPSLIMGDSRSQFTQTLSQNQTVIDRVDAKGIWHPSKIDSKLSTYRLDYAYAFELSQIGVSIPIVQKERGAYSSSGIADSQISWGYEFLPDWDYHPWRPKGVGFLQLIIPSGNFNDSSDMGGAENLGQGHWGIGAGTVFIKNISKWDFSANLDAHHFMPRSTRSNDFTGTIQPGYGGHLGAGLGWNKKDFRLGSSVEWTMEQAMTLKAEPNHFSSPGAEENYTTVFINFSYTPSNKSKNIYQEENNLFSNISYSLSWADQTLLGHPTNTSLGRTLSFSLQKRWLR